MEEQKETTDFHYCMSALTADCADIQDALRVVWLALMEVSTGLNYYLEPNKSAYENQQGTISGIAFILETCVKELRSLEESLESVNSMAFAKKQ